MNSMENMIKSLMEQVQALKKDNRDYREELEDQYEELQAKSKIIEELKLKNYEIEMAYYQALSAQASETKIKESTKSNE